MTDSSIIILNDIRKDALHKADESKSYDRVIEAILAVDDMSHTARKEGLLSLEEKFVLGVKDSIAEDIKYGTLLVVDGTDPDLVVEITSNEYLASKYEGNEALKQYILIRGVLAVQEGLNPRVIEEIMVALLPIELRDYVRKLLDTNREQRERKNRRELLDRYSTWTGVEPEDSELKDLVKGVNKLILNLDDRALQRALRDINCNYVTICLIYCSTEARQRLSDNMSTRLKALLIDDMYSIVNCLDEQLTESKKAMSEIIRIINKLVNIGEIIM